MYENAQELAESGEALEGARRRTDPPPVALTTTHGGGDRRDVLDETRRARTLEETAAGKELMSQPGGCFHQPVCAARNNTTLSAVPLGPLVFMASLFLSRSAP